MNRRSLTSEQVSRIRSLEDGRGGITPSRVVADARDEASPLHALFTWDDVEAADAYRLIEARVVLQSVHSAHATATAIIVAPHYVRDPEVDGRAQGYRSVVALRLETDRARDALIHQLESAAGFVRRAVSLAEPLGMAAELDELLDRVVGLQRVIATAA